jgi:hypothetical protein
MRGSMLIAGALAILTSASTQPANADIRSDFRDGCASGRGSYVENVDNVQCKTSRSVTITCDKAIKHCNATNVVVQPCMPAISHQIGKPDTSLGIVCPPFEAATPVPVAPAAKPGFEPER